MLASPILDCRVEFNATSVLKLVMLVNSLAFTASTSLPWNCNVFVVGNHLILTSSPILQQNGSPFAPRPSLRVHCSSSILRDSSQNFFSSSEFPVHLRDPALFPCVNNLEDAIRNRLRHRILSIQMKLAELE